MSLLSETLEVRAHQLRAEFDDAVPFRHLVIDDFFDPTFCRRLQADFPGFDERYARNEMGDVGGKAVRQDLPSLSESFAALDQLLQSEHFLQLIGRITGIGQLLYDADYVGGGTHENVHGQSLAPHVDFNYLPRTGWHRRLNLIVYLNDEWAEEWGGCLDLHSDPWRADDEVKKVVPAFNRCVIFETTERSWHGFEAIDLPAAKRQHSRRSVAIYLYTRQRDPAETAPSHGTIYVPPGLPRNLAAGHTLTDEEYLELRRRFTQLRGQLKFQYRRELESSALIATLTNSVSDARAAVAFPLQGYAVQEGPLKGYWPDGWGEAELSGSFRLTERARQLQLDVWVPPLLDRDPLITVRVNEQEQSLRIRRGYSARLRLRLRLAAKDMLWLRIQCSADFVPAAHGDASDDRPLAFRVVSAVVS